MRKFFGKNKLNAKDLFNERKKYQTWMDGFSANKTKFIDIWYDHPFYGRIDKKGRITYPSEGFLKSIAQRHGEEIYLMNFAADMFNDFIEHWNALQSSQKLHPESKLLVIKPERAWQNVHALYHLYMNTLYIAFSDAVRKTTRPKNIEEMIDLLIEFVREDSRFNLITKSSFVISKYSDPLVSGLMVDIETFKHDLDRKKEDFMDDNNFLMFKNAAQKFNFKLDENAPWRMIVDIDGPNLPRFLEKYQLTKDSIFDEQYYVASDFDIENFKTYMLGYWNKLNDQNLISESITRNEQIVVKEIKKKKMKLTKEQLDKMFSNAFWNVKYTNILSIELQNDASVQRALMLAADKDGTSKISNLFQKSLSIDTSPNAIVSSILRKRGKSSIQSPSPGRIPVFPKEPVIVGGNAEGSGTMTGVAYIDFISSGAASGSGVVQGGAYHGLYTSGSAMGQGTLSGGYSTVFLNTSGSAAGVGSVSGDGYIRFLTSGSAAAVGSLSGDYDWLDYLTSGSTTGVGSLGGDNSYLDFLPSGAASGSGELSGDHDWLDYLTSGSVAGVGSLSGDHDWLDYLTSGSVAGVGALGGDNSWLDYFTSGSADGSGSISASGTLEADTFPGFVSHAWEADYGVVTSSQVDHVIAWEAVTGSEWFDYGSGGDKGATYIADYSGSGTPGLEITGSNSWALRCRLSSTLQSSWTCTIVAEYLSSSVAASGDRYGVLSFGGDHGYGTETKLNLQIIRDTTQHVWEMVGKYAAGTSDPNSSGDRELFHLGQCYNTILLNTSSMVDVDFYHTTPTDGPDLVFDDYDGDTYDRWDQTDWDEIYLSHNRNSADESAPMVIRAIYMTTASLSSGERLELNDYIESTWYEQDFGETWISGQNPTIWLDTMDTGSLWEESTRTTNVTGSGSPVEAWDDQTSNGYDFSNGSSTLIYHTSSFSDMPSVSSSNNANDILVGETSFLHGTPCTVVTAYKNSGHGGTDYMGMQGAGGSIRVFYAPEAATGTGPGFYDGSSHEAFGSTVLTGNIAAVVNFDSFVGQAQLFTGSFEQFGTNTSFAEFEQTEEHRIFGSNPLIDVGEYIFFNYSMNDFQISGALKYLRDKWNL